MATAAPPVLSPLRKRRTSARRWLGKVHGWIGAVSALFILLIAGSGFALSIVGTLFQWETGMLTRVTPADAPTAEPAAFIEAAVAQAGEGYMPMGVMMPGSRLDVEVAMTYGLPAGAESGDDVVIHSFDPASVAPLGDFVLHDTWSHWLLDFHHMLLMGEIGLWFTAIIGLLMMGFALLGLYLWFPGRARAMAKLKRLRPYGPRGAARTFSLHSIIGFWAGLFILVWVFTGVNWSKPEIFSPFLPELVTDIPADQLDRFAATCETAVSHQEAVSRALAMVPGSTAAITEVPSMFSPHHSIYLKQPGDWNRYEGSTRVWVHGSCPDIAHARLFVGNSVGETINTVGPSIHSGRTFGSLFGPILTMLIAAMLIIMAVTGFLTWRRRTFGKPR